MTPRARMLVPAALFAASGAIAAPLSAQVLHTNDRWKECAIVLDPSLTQAAWRRFVSEVGLVAYYRPQVGARPVGRGRMEFNVTQASTRIDPKSSAWNDTFSHPEADHYLIEGDALPIPSIGMRVGVSDRVDLGGYITKNLQSNYGLAGAQVQYAFRRDDARGVAAATRLTAGYLFGPQDAQVAVLGLDLVVSKRFSHLEPYAIATSYSSAGRETTSKVDLEDVAVSGTQGTLGLAVHLGPMRVAGEANFARVNGYALKVGFGW